LAWSAFFIWWGILELFPMLHDGTGALGISVILLGLNAIRSWNGIPTSGFTTTLGILALVLGGLQFVNAFIALPFELPIFAILLILFGLMLLGRELLHVGSR
jgi:hypothetical protein